ncbi:FMRFamide-related peptides-like [Pseudomyrmex gracilis]|uniref:FMRFamide-related peptides-like n=1 Tax=Pseudomyrmex gracilis TaxID=219809 RepID=UPI0009948EAC|nr:FMRFamide-related peptides-like [Pseudomyrmex gracilis]
MIALWTFNALVFLCNWAFVSSSILAPLKDDSNLRIFKELPNKFEYITKRHGIDDRKEDAESKERRSTMSSSFIRFGRSQSAFNVNDNSAALDSETDSKVDRHSRRKSADIVIRFGRSKLKNANNEQLKRGKSDLNFIRFGRNVQLVPADVDLSAVCQTIMSNNMISDAELHPDVARLLRLCNSLNKITGEINVDDLFEDQADLSRRE